ncbi:hypothetical protein EV286_107344 [Rhizobium sp. BK251]|nr:hypothetical protein EV286_107344 [Rhizobium sp. BK251]
MGALDIRDRVRLDPKDYTSDDFVHPADMYKAHDALTRMANAVRTAIQEGVVDISPKIMSHNSQMRYVMDICDRRPLAYLGLVILDLRHHMKTLSQSQR